MYRWLRVKDVELSGHCRTPLRTGPQSIYQAKWMIVNAQLYILRFPSNLHEPTLWEGPELEEEEDVEVEVALVAVDITVSACGIAGSCRSPCSWLVAWFASLSRDWTGVALKNVKSEAAASGINNVYDRVLHACCIYIYIHRIWCIWFDANMSFMFLFSISFDKPDQISPWMFDARTSSRRLGGRQGSLVFDSWDLNFGWHFEPKHRSAWSEVMPLKFSSRLGQDATWLRPDGDCILSWTGEIQTFSLFSLGWNQTCTIFII